ncbi:unnamed protein product [Urochloa humidicola]
MTILVISVDLECCRCRAKITKVLDCLKEKFCIEKVEFEDKLNKVIVRGKFCGKKLSKKICCKAGRIIKEIKIVEVWPPPKPKPEEPKPKPKPEEPKPKPKPEEPKPKPEESKPKPKPEESKPKPEEPKPKPKPEEPKPKPEEPKPKPKPEESKPKPEEPKPKPKPEEPKPKPPPKPEVKLVPYPCWPWCPCPPYWSCQCSKPQPLPWPPHYSCSKDGSEHGGCSCNDPKPPIWWPPAPPPPPPPGACPPWWCDVVYEDTPGCSIM